MQELALMPVHRETRLTTLALYQQALRTAERVKTLMREMDEVSREVHQHLDDLDIIIEEIEGNERRVACAVEKDSRRAESVRNTVGKLPGLPPVPIRSTPGVTPGKAS
jgi:hypothetical protein